MNGEEQLCLIKAWKDCYACQDSLNLLVSLESILEWIPGITALFKTPDLLSRKINKLHQKKKTPPPNLLSWLEH